MIFPPRLEPTTPTTTPALRRVSRAGALQKVEPARAASSKGFYDSSRSFAGGLLALGLHHGIAELVRKAEGEHSTGLSANNALRLYEQAQDNFAPDERTALLLHFSA